MWELPAFGTTTPGLGTAYSGRILWLGNASER